LNKRLSADQKRGIFVEENIKKGKESKTIILAFNVKRFIFPAIPFPSQFYELHYLKSINYSYSKYQFIHSSVRSPSLTYTFSSTTALKYVFGGFPTPGAAGSSFLPFILT
jgi:hypothetical protein